VLRRGKQHDSFGRAAARSRRAWYGSMLEGSMDSVRSFVKLWAGFTIVILGYAIIDLRTNPWLYDETKFTMRPDLSQIGDLVHWGGRLLKEQALSLLVGNALVLAGLLTLLLFGIVRLLRRPRSAPVAVAADEEPVAVFGADRLSVPPQG
jgi:hypothetical protein